MWLHKLYTLVLLPKLRRRHSATKKQVAMQLQFFTKAKKEKKKKIVYVTMNF